ncbi:MAG: extracellular solute-binding protein, partial [Candidatus Limnocylindrales bacterium]
QDMVPLAFGNQPQWPAGHQFSMTLSNLVGREGLDAKLYGESPWNDEDTVRAIDIYFREFQDAGYFPRDPNAVTYEDANALFYAGEAAMLPTGTWLVAEITDNTDFEVGFFPFPAIDGGEGVFPPAGLGGGLFVAEASDDKQAAFEFLNWLQSEEVVREWSLQTFNVIPAQEIDSAGLDVSPLFQSVLDDLAQSSGETSDFGYNIDVLTPANFNDEMFTGFQEVLNGTRTPQELADALEAAYQEAAERGETLERPEE